MHSNQAAISHKNSILIVDNQEENILILEHYLSEYPLNFLYAGSSEEALSIMSKQQPSLVLLDMGLPDSNGYQMLNKIQSNPNICHIPIVLMMPNLSHPQKALNTSKVAGIEVLVKPIEISNLKNIIDLYIYMEKGKSIISSMHDHNDSIIESKEEGLLGINSSGKIVYANNSATRHLSVRPSQLIGLYLESIFEEPNDKVASHWSEHPVSLICEKKTILQVEKAVFWREDGSKLNVKFAAVPVFDNEHIAMVLAFKKLPIDKEVSTNEKIVELHDMLTGLPSRNKLLYYTNDFVKKCNEKSVFFLFYIDLDHFKNINETVGHEVGDTLLLEVANRLKSVVPTRGLLARIGSDEFCFAADNLGKIEQAALLAGKINRCLRSPFLIKGHELYISCSIGIANYPSAGDTASALLKNVEIATQRAKVHGRNNFHFFNAQDNAGVIERIQLEHDLHQAFERRRLRVEFIPVSNFGSGKPYIFQADLIWDHPHKGRLRLCDFQALAEDAGLLHEITDWALDVTFLRLHEDLYGKKWWNSVKMALSVGAKTLMDAKFCEKLLARIKDYKFSPSQMIIEVPENLAVLADEVCHENLILLKQAGISLVLSEFGSKYAPFKLIQSGLFDYIKLSESYVKAACMDDFSSTLLESLGKILKKQGLMLWVDRSMMQTQLDSVLSFQDLCTENTITDSSHCLTLEEILELGDVSVKPAVTEF